VDGMSGKFAHSLSLSLGLEKKGLSFGRSSVHSGLQDGLTQSFSFG